MEKGNGGEGRPPRQEDRGATGEDLGQYESTDEKGRHPQPCGAQRPHEVTGVDHLGNPGHDEESRRGERGGSEREPAVDGVPLPGPPWPRRGARYQCSEEQSLP